MKFIRLKWDFCSFSSSHFLWLNLKLMRWRSSANFISKLNFKIFLIGVLYRYWKNLVWLIYLFREKYSIIFSTFLMKTFKHIMWWFCIITLIIKQCSCLKINFLAFHSGHLTTFFVCLCSRKLNFLVIQLTKKYEVKLITSVHYGLNYFWLF